MDKQTVIGTVTDGRGGRREIIVTEFQSNGKTVFSLENGHDCSSFKVQVNRAKRWYAHPSCKAEWAV